MKAYGIAGLAVGTLLWCGAAAGEEVHVSRDAYGEVRQIDVRVGDLDLARADGAGELLARIAFAAVRVCGGAESDERDWNVRKLRRDCITDTMDRAVASVPSPLLKRLYESSHDDGRTKSLGL